MKFLESLTIVLNILMVFVLTAGLFCKFDNPKYKAYFGYTMVGSMLLFLISLSLLILLEILIHHYYGFLYLFLVVISPFLIGKAVEHKTLKTYTFIQILFFMVSLFSLITDSWLF